MKLKDLKPSITQLKPHEAEQIHRTVRQNRAMPMPTKKKKVKPTVPKKKTIKNKEKRKQELLAMLALLDKEK